MRSRHVGMFQVRERSDSYVVLRRTNPGVEAGLLPGKQLCQGHVDGGPIDRSKIRGRDYGIATFLRCAAK